MNLTELMREIGHSWHYWLLLVALLGVGAFVQYRERAPEIVPPREALANLPKTLGAWRNLGEDRAFDADIISVLRPHDYLWRDYYQPETGKTANVYVGYYDTQRTGATYHSPQNCLPGSGWTMTEPEPIEIVLPDKQKFVANRYLIESKGEKNIMIYWYQGRGRFTANEYKDKILTVWDSVRLRRSDGAMVRVIAPLEKGSAESEQSAANIAAQLAAALPAFVP